MRLYDAGTGGCGKLKQSYRFVDLVFGTHNIFKFAELLVRCFEEQKMVIDIWVIRKKL